MTRYLAIPFALALLIVGASAPSAWGVDGNVFAFGNSESGQLGLGTLSAKNPTPTIIDGLVGVVAVAAGGYHTLFLLDDGSVYACGYNEMGQLGLGDTERRTTPVLVPGLPAVKAIAAGSGHSLFVAENGDVYSCGENAAGQLGLGDAAVGADPHSTPTRVPGLTGVQNVAAGVAHSLFLLDAGCVYSCGRNNDGQCGFPGSTAYSDAVWKTSPAQIPALAGVTAIAAGSSHSLFVLASGDVYACGKNCSGQLGNGTYRNCYFSWGQGEGMPVKVQLPSSERAERVAGGNDYSLVLLESGEVYSFGDFAYGKLGRPYGGSGPTAYYIPLPVPGLTDVVGIAAGYHSMFLLESGDVYACGPNTRGQLGIGSSDDYLSPHNLTQVPGLPPAAAIAVGTMNSFVIAAPPPSPEDTTPPGAVGDLTASSDEDTQSTLRWTNPPDADLAEVVAMRRSDGYPSDHSDGTQCYRDASPTPGQSVTATDSGLTNGTTYYYAVFSQDANGNWNDTTEEGMNLASATPAAQDTTPPATVQNFAAAGGNGQALLQWTNPPSGDLAEVVVQRRTSRYPTSHSDGTQCYQSTSSLSGQPVSVTDSGLSNGTTYYYAVFSRDASENWNDSVAEGENAATARPVAGNQPPDTKIFAATIDEAAGTAWFAWSGTDDHTAAANLEFQYRLIPRDSWSEWATTAARNSVSYAGLATGDYRFEVRAKDSSSAVDPSPAVRSLTIPVEKRVPVIIIPGVMGSELTTPISSSDDVVVWPYVAIGPFGLWAASPDWLTLTETGQNSPIRPIHVGGIIRDLPTQRIALCGVYGPLIDYLASNGLAEGTEVFTFPYDWRKSLVTSADHLRVKIQETLERTGASAVDIVAHSMGGLVTRQYLNSTPNAPVGKVILLGVPSHGSPDAYQMLHPDLVEGMFLMSASDVHEIARTSPSVFQLLPTKRFFELYIAIFEDLYGYKDAEGVWQIPGLVNGASPAETWEKTYLENPNSELTTVNDVLLQGPTVPYNAWSFHETLGASLRFAGDTYIVAGSGRPTNLVFMKRAVHAGDPSAWAAGLLTHDIWSVRPINGDGRVPLMSATRLHTDGPVSVFHTDASHNGMLRDDDVLALVVSILKGSPKATGSVRREQDPTEESREKQAYQYKSAAEIVVKSPVELHIYDPLGDHIGPDFEGIVETTAQTAYFTLGENTIAYLPVAGVYELELHGLAGGEFGIEFLVFDSEGLQVRGFSLDGLPTTPSTRATVRFDPGSPAAPILQLDLDGDGTPETTHTAVPGNTPLGSGVSLSFCEGAVDVTFPVVTSAGATYCGCNESLDTADLPFTPITPAFRLLTTAAFVSPAQIMVHYAQSDSPVAEEGVVRLYRIESDGSATDITSEPGGSPTQVSGTSDRLGLFMAGLAIEGPEIKLTYPQGGEILTGASCTIRWEASAAEELRQALAVSVDYRPAGRSSWTVVATEEDNDGAFAWSIGALPHGEYELRVVARNEHGMSAEAVSGSFTIGTAVGAISVGPNPVRSAGMSFFYTLPAGMSNASLVICDVTGKRVIEIPVSGVSVRYPDAGRWDPADEFGVPLANGPYVCVLVADGRVIARVKLVIQR